jgi:flagellar biosynthesis protein FlhF
LADLTRRVEELYRLREPAKNSDRAGDEWRGLRDHLEHLEVSDDLRRQCLEIAQAKFHSPRSPHDPQLADLLIQFLMDRFEVAPSTATESEARRVIALVGPAGVGKTTTIAKLAAASSLQGKQVALVTLDTYRIAAAEQLRVYAEVLDLPLAICATAEQFQQALARFADRDLVLVDTDGRAAIDAERMSQLGSLLGQDVETHLVLSACLRDSSWQRALDRFAGLNYRRLILTKLDETPGTGVLATLAESAQVPISFLSTGQDVPDDIEEADRRRLAELALGYAAIRQPVPMGLNG